MVLTLISTFHGNFIKVSKAYEYPSRGKAEIFPVYFASKSKTKT